MTDTHYYVPEEKLDRVAAVYRPVPGAHQNWCVVQL